MLRIKILFRIRKTPPPTNIFKNVKVYNSLVERKTSFDFPGFLDKNLYWPMVRRYSLTFLEWNTPSGLRHLDEAINRSDKFGCVHEPIRKLHSVGHLHHECFRPSVGVSRKIYLFLVRITVYNADILI